MKHRLSVLLLAVGLSLSAAPVLAQPTALDGSPILPDPSLNHDHVLPASVATAGVARVSAALDGPLKDCSRHNPCALPTPAKDRVDVRLAPPKPAQNKLARVAKSRRA